MPGGCISGHAAATGAAETTARTNIIDAPFGKRIDRSVRRRAAPCELVRPGTTRAAMRQAVAQQGPGGCKHQERNQGPEEAAAYAAAVDEATAGSETEDGPKVRPAGSLSTESESGVVSGTDGPAPSGKDKIENLTGEWWKSSPVVDPGMAGKEPDEEWWKDLEGLDESMLGMEKDQWSRGGCTSVSVRESESEGEAVVGTTIDSCPVGVSLESLKKIKL